MRFNLSKYIVIIPLIIFFAGGFNLAWSNDIYKETLDNGLVVILKEDHTNPIATMQVFFRAGSIYEGEYLGAGISHFVEHMIMEGTESGMTKEEIDEKFDVLGAIGNAATWRDYTTYYETVPSRNLQETMELFSECLFEAEFPEVPYQSQREIILREIEMGKDEPNRILQKAFYRTAFRQHPIKYPTIGLVEEFKKITREDLIKYYQKFYVPNNAVLAIVGDIDIEETIEDVKEIFGEYSYKALPPIYYEGEPEQFGKREEYIEGDFSMSYVRIGFHTMSIFHPDMPAMDVLSNILSEGRSSILNVRIKQTKGLVESISSWNYTPPYDAGAFNIYAVMEHEKMEKAISEIWKELEKLKTEKVDKEVLEKAVSQAKAEFLLGSETTTSQARTLAMNELYNGNPLFDEIYIDMLEEVTPEDIMRVASEYLTEDNMTIIRLSKKAPQVMSEGEVEKGELEISRTTLDNGLRVIVIGRHSAPTVSVGAYLLGGVEHDPEGKVGLSRLTSKMLVMGADGMSSVDIAEAIESAGGKLEADSGITFNSLKLSIISENIEEGFEVFSKCLTEPDFKEKPFKQQKINAINDCISEDDTWETHAFKKMRKLLFPDHNYKFTSNGDLDDVKSITIDDLKKLYQQRFHPENIVLTFVGDIEEETALGLADRFLGDWKSDEPYITEPEGESVHYGDPTVLEEDWKHGQTVICYGFPTFKRSDEDYYATLVLDGVLSGIIMPGGRLHDRLRKEGYVYVVHAFNVTLSSGGYFGIYLATTEDKYEQARQIVEEELARIKTEPVSEDELTIAKENAISARLTYNFQSNNSISDFVSIDELNDIEYKRFLDTETGIKKITAEDVLEVANKYLVDGCVFIGHPE